MFWQKKKAGSEDISRLVAQNFYPFFNPVFPALVKAAKANSGNEPVQNALAAVRALHVISCVYSGLCIMETADAGLRTADGDARIDALVRAGMKDFMKEAPDLYVGLTALFESRVSEINAVLQLCGGKQRSEGESLLIMYAFDRIFGREGFASHADALHAEIEVLTRAIFDLRIAFRNGLKR
ncbi:conserved hypothetical protein [Hyphomicrobiales bacterium]|nr:conserved hypothetical protein [Hyphomicrobiales bacterium]CAH1702948.1 conserved hypothetical protein [Hyphomicrobiales bacterium]CAI0347133.1 conserved hypothetical protein [Hyphomicrobiales bacterium]